MHSIPRTFELPIQISKQLKLQHTFKGNNNNSMIFPRKREE
jgi:hypothetical protein